MLVLKHPRRIPVFVYGTLRNKVNGTLIGTDSHTVMPMYMYDGIYPVVTDFAPGQKSNHRARVLGQHFLVDINEFARMDHYEGFPSFYTRKMVEIVVRYDDGEKSFAKAWMYMGRDDGTGAALDLDARPIVYPNDLGYLDWDNQRIPF